MVELGSLGFEYGHSVLLLSKTTRNHVFSRPPVSRKYFEAVSLRTCGLKGCSLIFRPLELERVAQIK
jgi:hypothetical protein